MAATDITPTETLPYRRCVGLMLIGPGGKVFCGERRDTKGAWQMPQGGIQKGEDPAMAAMRELKEEVGVEERFAVILGRTKTLLRYDFPDYHKSVYTGKYRGQEQIWFALRFIGTDADIDLVKHNDPEGPEFCRWEWATPASVIERIVPFKKPVYEAVMEEFKALLVP